jgi:hypothetical protein
MIRGMGVSSFNLNPKYPYLQYIGMRIMQAAGLPASDAIPVELRRNGVGIYARWDGRAGFWKMGARRGLQ